LFQLEKLKGDNSCLTVSSSADTVSSTDRRTSDAHSLSTAASSTSRQRYPQPSLENLLSEPPPSSFMSSVRPSSVLALASSEVDLQQLQLHIAALELQVSTLRDALHDAQDQCSFFEKQCNWFKKKELELQLSQDRNSSASDLDYLRRRAASSIEFVKHFSTDNLFLQRDYILYGIARCFCDSRHCSGPAAVSFAFYYPLLCSENISHSLALRL
jgi:hypothetical protein